MALKDNTPRGSSPAVSRNWEIIVYPESCPEAKEMVAELASECKYLLSPLHDKDVNADGTPKKPHYHLYVYYAGNKSYKQMQELSATYSSNVPPKRVGDKAESIRYSCHYNTPKKAKYKPEDILTNIEDIGSYFATAKEKREAKASTITQIREFAQAHNVCDLADLIDCLCDAEQFDLLTYVEEHTYLVKTYVEQKSQRNANMIKTACGVAEVMATQIKQRQDQIIKQAVWEYLGDDFALERFVTSYNANKLLIKEGKIQYVKD